MLDFSLVTSIIRQNFKENEDPGQIEFIRRLFHSYLMDENEEYAEVESTQVCRWLKGTIKVSPTIALYYTNTKKNQYALSNDILKLIIPLIFDIGMVVNELRDAILDDNSLSKSMKKKMLPNEEIKSDEDLAEYLTDLIVFTLQKPFVKRDIGKNGLLPTNAKSDLVEYRIYTDDIPLPCPCFTGRDNELKKLGKLISAHTKVMVTGVAGIGKTELVKAYIKKHKKDFTNILYISYSGNLHDDIAKLDFSDDLPSEDMHTRFTNHNRFLRSLKEDSLIVIDGFNTTEEKERVFSVVKKYRSHVIFTTRSRFSKIASMEVREIEDTKNIKSIFAYYYKKVSEYENEVEKIIETVHRHTFTVELSARLLKRGILSPEELLEKLREESVNISSTDEIDIDKDGVYSKDTYYGHIRKLFSLYLLDEESSYVMRCMTFIPLNGISKRLFAHWLEFDNLNLINNLIESGFISEKNDYDICLHPMIREISCADMNPAVSNCKLLLKSFIFIFIHHGLDIPFYQKLLFVTENIIATIDVDELDIYLRFLEDAFAFMQDYQWTSGQESILKEMKRILSEDDNGTLSDRALYNDYLAYMSLCDDKYWEAIDYEAKALWYASRDPDVDTLLLANIYSNLADEHMQVEDYDRAEEYILQAMDYLEKTDGTRMNDKIAMGANYALLLERKGKHKDAENILSNLKNDVKNSNTIEGKDYAYLEIKTGMMHLIRNEERKAKKCFEVAHRIYEKIYESDPELLNLVDIQMQQVYEVYKLNKKTRSDKTVIFLTKTN